MSKKSRRYVQVRVQMIAKDNSPETIRKHIFELLCNSDILQAGEIDIEVGVKGCIQINDNGYAVPWVQQAEEMLDDGFDEDALWEKHLHDKVVDREDRMGVPEDQR